MNLEGKMIGNRYEIIKKIGNGGMATVYKAKCHVLNRFVAIKVLRDEFTTDEEFIKRFRIEAQAAASLTHPNIVSIYDVGNEGDLYYIVMELIQGRTLKQIINEEGILTWKWAVNISIQIASALETAHRNNIVHRDIKPHNIIITEDGIAKVTDFGIAKAVSNSTITAFGTTIGSVHYFSPEHARGGYTDAKSDLYSLGVVMYEMLTGKVPFDADTPVSIALKHMQEQPKEPIEMNPAIPRSVNKIIMKAMQKDANLRYNTASEMLKDLSLALKNPDGDFVTISNEENNFNTQVVPTMYSANKSENEEVENKKEGKLKKFVKNHKVMSFFIGGILLFILTIGITYAATEFFKVKEVQIPNLVGMKKEEAESFVKESNLRFEVTSEEFNDEVPAGYIISQDPTYAENFKIKEKTTMKVILSKGQEVVKVPKVSGMTKEEAIKALEELNLVPDVIEETSKKVEEGYVISQDTDPNTEVKSGETVKIHVSTGTEKSKVPNVIGKTQEEAKKTLQGLGFTVTVTTAEDNSKDNGVIIKQSLDEGKTVEKGTEITITVNKLAEVKTVPIKVNVKSLLDGDIYETSSANETEEKKVKNVKLEVKVGEDTIYSQSVKASETLVTAGNAKGTGTTTVKVYIDGVLKNDGGYSLVYSNTSSYTAE